MPKVTTEVPKKIYKNITEEVELGIFSNASEAINSALKKAYAGKSRTFLKWMIKKEGISEAAILKELEALRK